MSNRPATFRQADVSRAVKGATAAGLTIGRIEIDPTGKIVLVAATEAARGPTGSRSGDVNEWDEVLK
jgi:hypothetical protein